ncbi:MAG: hypothetical protein K2N79_08715 [Muribaculaceae bacterium]|nr:hypothetical protein [Muribaculaceae bacterium]
MPRDSRRDIYIKRRRESHICCSSRHLRPTTALPYKTSNGPHADMIISDLILGKGCV